MITVEPNLTVSLNSAEITGLIMLVFDELIRLQEREESESRTRLIKKYEAILSTLESAEAIHATLESASES